MPPHLAAPAPTLWTLPTQGPVGFLDLPPPGRLFVAALRAGRADLIAATPWPESEMLALGEAVGLLPCAAARLGACVALLLREARVPPVLLAPGSPALSLAEAVLAAAVTGPEDAQREARRRVLPWMPARRRVPALALLALAAADLRAWRAVRAG
jgi:hypothetical protein